MKKIKVLFFKYWITLLGMALGAIGGYLYWLYVGCQSGGCPITSSPLNSTVWGVLTGGVLFDIFRIRKKK